MIINSTQFLFWSCAFGLTLILSVIVILPLLRRSTVKPEAHANLTQLNVIVFKERLAELEADHRSHALDADEYFEQKTDLERQLLAAHAGHVDLMDERAELSRSSTVISRWVGLIIFLIIPLLSFATYYLWNKDQQTQHRALLDFWANQDQYAEVADGLMTGRLNQAPAATSGHAFELLQAMQGNAYQHPFDATRWMNLSKAYMDANAIEPALAALGHAYRLKPENNDIAIAYAQMRFFSLQGKMDSVTQSIVARILVQNPDHEGALLLMSMATYHDQHYNEAIYWLQRLKRVRLARATLSQPVNPAIIAQLDQTIRDAEVASKKLEQNASDRAK
ncbi:MAG: c-type cytochrome biogenesis protein CcmI [Gammaproteobacteria bacterium]|nr:c-type cytochrome biogenesis protein CcmI [Gammaproteobacteria bacterium]